MEELIFEYQVEREYTYCMIERIVCKKSIILRKGRKDSFFSV